MVRIEVLEEDVLPYDGEDRVPILNLLSFEVNLKAGQAAGGRAVPDRNDDLALARVQHEFTHRCGSGSWP
ncbi:MAG: hypothetical protein M5U26_27770 [Planctomycetota bacterium]|nr:hypothetical protein [Planctomycetota bacterium]